MICISQLGLEGLRVRYPGYDAATVIYNGVRAATSRCEYTEPPEGPLIVWAGSFIPRKRPFLALDTFARVLQAYPNARLVMLGDGPLRPAVVNAAAVVSDRIKVPGHVSDVMDHFSRGSLFLQTSANEGIAYTLLEALSAGLPAVATACGATGEAVLDGSNGLLAPIDQVEPLAEGCRRLLSDERLRRRFGTNAVLHISSQFSLDTMVARTLEAYRRFCRCHFECIPPMQSLTTQVAPSGDL
jgi:glycosyltransferase involved in cell wall biosynthesis